MRIRSAGWTPGRADKSRRVTLPGWLTFIRATILGAWVVGAMTLLFTLAVMLLGDGRSPPFRWAEMIAIGSAALWFYAVFVAGIVRPWPRLLTAAFFVLPIVVFAALWLQTPEWGGPALIVGLALLPFAVLRGVLALMFGE